MHEIVDWGGVVFGLAAAILWAWAAFKRVPRLSVPYGGEFGDDDPHVVATESVSRLSRWASGVTALAVGCQTVSALIEKLSN